MTFLKNNRLSDNLELWPLLALADRHLEHTNLVVANLTVARGLKAFQTLGIVAYAGRVDSWTNQFRTALPGMERVFRETPWRWKNDIRFCRVGMLQGFLGHEVGLRYID